MRQRPILLGILLLGTLFLSGYRGCLPAPVSPVEQPADGDAATGAEVSTAPFRLALTDAPIDEADAVYITVTGVEVHLVSPAAEEPEPQLPEGPGPGPTPPAGAGNGNGNGNGQGNAAEEPAAEAPAAEAPAAEEPAAEEPGAEEPVGDGAGEGRWITLAVEPHRVNLLDLQNNVRDALASEELPLGSYNQIRLLFDCAEGSAPSIVIGGVESPLTIPSGCNNGVRMNHTFELTGGKVASFVLDFDVRKSVHQTGNGRYMMRPTVRVVDTATAGSITGSVSPGDVGAVVYAFSEDQGFPLSATFPADAAVTSAIVTTPDGTFSLAALPVGAYDVVVVAEGFAAWIADGVEVLPGDGETFLDAIELVPVP